MQSAWARGRELTEREPHKEGRQEHSLEEDARVVQEIVQSREPLRPFPALFHPKKQPLAQLSQLSQLLLQHLMDMRRRRRVEVVAGAPWTQACILLHGLTPQLFSLWS